MTTAPNSNPSHKDKEVVKFDFGYEFFAAGTLFSFLASVFNLVEYAMGHPDSSSFWFFASSLFTAGMLYGALKHKK